jgi:xanthine dehydrogenase accessory factor
MEKNPIIGLAKAIQNKQPAVLATVIETKGASPAKVGAQIVFFEDGTITGNAGGGKLEATILEDARRALTDNLARLTHYSLSKEGPDAVGMICGGEVRVFIQPFPPAPQLIIVGGGHIGCPLKEMGEIAGFEIVMVDVEPGRGDVLGMEAVPFTTDSYVVLITTDHVSDEAGLRIALRSPARYIGMIGSRVKIRTILEHLKADGFSKDALRRVYAPIGLNLGGPTPEEIAVAILAEVIAVRRGAKISIRER